MTDKHINKVLEVIDGGLQQADPQNYRAGVRPDLCIRENCRRPAAAGHAFCGPCYQWICCETDDDPCPTTMPQPAPLAPPVPNSYYPGPQASCDWVDYLSGYGYYGID